MFLTAIVASLALAASDTAKGDVPTVLEAHFLAIDAQGEVVETTSIPHRPGASCYSWVLLVEPENRTLSVRELFELPDSAETWNSDPSAVTVVNRDRSGAVTEFEESLGDGVITHSWCVAEGDPVGPHRIRVFVGDRLLHDFRFSVVAESY